MSESAKPWSRRAFLPLLPVSFGFPTMAAQSNPAMRSFHVAIPQSVINGIAARVRRAHWPDRLDGSAWQYGVDWNYMRELADYWTTRDRKSVV